MSRENIERRSKARFPLNMPVKFRSTSGGAPHSGTGVVVDISSRGLSLHSETSFKSGTQVTASLSWPARLDGECMLQLLIEGRVLRAEAPTLVISIDRHEFRTSGRIADTGSHIPVLARQFERLIAPSGAAR
jgi:hypothetical protein